ncbi:MAG: hypothetical protein WC373_11080 [Smithella sp.]|jgi:hypothetical protein
MAEDERYVVWRNGTPRCPCGGHLFETTFQCLNREWLIEWIYCLSCKSSITITPDLERWIRNEKWGIVK